MNEGSNPTSDTSRKSRTYFFIGFSLLFIMAITWSLDDSFVYTSLGAAVFFFFLAYHHRQRQAGNFRSRQYSSQRGSGFSSMFDTMKKGQRQTKGKPAVQSQAVDNSKKFVMFIVLFIGSVFLFIIVSIIVSESSNSGYESSEYYSRAEEARYAGNYDTAELYYRKALTDDPENLNALNGLGIISLDRQRYDDAINRFDDALRVDPDFEYARYNKALTLYYQKNYKRSLSESFNLLERSPDYYDVMQLVGDNYYDQQRYDSARYWYDEGYNNGLRNAWICHVLGYLYDRNNETAKAVELYREALSYDSFKIEVYDRLGQIYPGPEGEFFRSKSKELQQSVN